MKCIDSCCAYYVAYTAARLPVHRRFATARYLRAWRLQSMNCSAITLHLVYHDQYQQQVAGGIVRRKTVFIGVTRDRVTELLLVCWHAIVDAFVQHSSTLEFGHVHKSGFACISYLPSLLCATTDLQASLIILDCHDTCCSTDNVLVLSVPLQ